MIKDYYSCLCGDLSRLHRHLKSFKTSLKHPKACKVCGGDTYSISGIYAVPLHLMPSKGRRANKTCFIDYHDDCFFGLAGEDKKSSRQKSLNGCIQQLQKEKKTLSGGNM